MCACLHLCNCLCLCPSLSSDSPCCMWTATSVWTCRLRRTRWSPLWETATAAALSSGCSVTWPWVSDPSPHLPSPPTTTTHPNQSWLSTPSAGGSYHARHNTPLPVTAWPANTEIQAAVACLPLWRRLLLQLATGFERSCTCHSGGETSCGFGDLVVSKQGERCVRSVHGEHWNQSTHAVSHSC